MRIRSFLYGLAVATCAMTGVIALAPISSAAPPSPTDTARLAAAGIDVSKLKPGWSLAGDEVFWNGGDVTLSLAPQHAADCDVDRVCLFQHADFNHPLPLELRGAGWHNMDWYGFNDQMSSWWNRTLVDARWYFHNPLGNPPQPFPNRCMPPATADSYVFGQPENDEMTFLFIFDNANSC